MTNEELLDKECEECDTSPWAAVNYNEDVGAWLCNDCESNYYEQICTEEIFKCFSR